MRFLLFLVFFSWCGCASVETSAKPLDLKKTRAEFDQSMEKLADLSEDVGRQLCRAMGKGEACQGLHVGVARTYLAPDGWGIGVMVGQDGKERVRVFEKTSYGWRASGGEYR